MIIPQFVSLFCIVSNLVPKQGFESAEAIQNEIVQRRNFSRIQSSSSSEGIPPLNPEEAQRAKYCGREQAKEPFRYHRETRRCYPGGKQGPCGDGMMFYSADPVFGICDCEERERTMIYHPETGRCYPIFTQAYCRPNQWLILALEKGKIKQRCETDRCYKFNANARRKNASQKEFILYGNNCVPIETPCGINKSIKFQSGRINPGCFETISYRNPVAFSVGSTAPSGSCKPGTVLSYTGQCSPVFEF